MRYKSNEFTACASVPLLICTYIYIHVQMWLYTDAVLYIGSIARYNIKSLSNDPGLLHTGRRSCMMYTSFYAWIILNLSIQIRSNIEFMDITTTSCIFLLDKSSPSVESLLSVLATFLVPRIETIKIQGYQIKSCLVLLQATFYYWNYLICENFLGDKSCKLSKENRYPLHYSPYTTWLTSALVHWTEICLNHKQIGIWYKLKYLNIISYSSLENTSTEYLSSGCTFWRQNCVVRNDILNKPKLIRLTNAII